MTLAGVERCPLQGQLLSLSVVPKGKLPHSLSPRNLPEAMAIGRSSRFLKGFWQHLFTGRGHGQVSTTVLKGKAQGS